MKPNQIPSPDVLIYMNRRRFLATSIATCSIQYFPFRLGAETPGNSLDPALRAKITAAVQKGLDFLKKAQKPEGFWSSADFPGLSSLAIQAFIGSTDPNHRKADAVQSGLEFVRKSAKPDGGIYNKGLANYNTSIAMATLILAGDQKDKQLIESGRKFLIGAQRKNSDLSHENGGFSYEASGTGPQSRPDMDNTVYSIEALALHRQMQARSEAPGQADLNWKAAIEFVTRCQNLKATNSESWASDEPAEKGGFTYTPRGDEKGTHSYGTMTYAGLLSLVHAEVGKDDPRVKAAIDWLSRHYTLEENPGQGQQGLYYYYFVMAKGLTAAGVDSLSKADGKAVNWRTELGEKLLSLQKPDGSWANENGRWMEKDPVLVTSYVLIALNTLGRPATGRAG